MKAKAKKKEKGSIDRNTQIFRHKIIETESAINKSKISGHKSSSIYLSN